MNPSPATAPGVRLRHITQKDVWRRLSLLEKIAVVQLGFAACTFGLLVLLVMRS